jgi:hypothetical protein
MSFKILLFIFHWYALLPTAFFYCSYFLYGLTSSNILLPLLLLFCIIVSYIKPILCSNMKHFSNLLLLPLLFHHTSVSTVFSPIKLHIYILVLICPCILCTLLPILLCYSLTPVFVRPVFRFQIPSSFSSPRPVLPSFPLTRQFILFSLF